MRRAKSRDIVIGAAVLAAGVIGGLAWDNENDRAETAQAKVEVAKPLGEQVRDACNRNRTAVEMEFGISCERSLAVVSGETSEGEIDDPEIQDSEIQDPEVQDPETQDPEIQDPEVDDPDPDDPEVQESEIQEFEIQDPQDPPTMLRLYEADGATVFRICTLLPGPDAEVREYRCDVP